MNVHGMAIGNPPILHQLTHRPFCQLRQQSRKDPFKDRVDEVLIAVLVSQEIEKLVFNSRQEKCLFFVLTIAAVMDAVMATVVVMATTSRCWRPTHGWSMILLRVIVLGGLTVHDSIRGTATVTRLIIISIAIGMSSCGGAVGVGGKKSPHNWSRYQREDTGCALAFDGPGL